MKLVGAPDPYEYESPASWVTRLALSQGVTVPALFRYLDLEGIRDIDYGFTDAVAKKVSRLTGVHESQFLYQRHMIRNLRSVKSSASKLLVTRNKRPAYRFCPACLGSNRNKYFQLHWRFECWRMCPLHHCLLLDMCPQCGCAIRLPDSMIDAGPDQRGIAWLNRCLRCGNSICSDWTKVVGSLQVDQLSQSDRTYLENGRAVLAAVAVGYFNIYGEEKSFPVSELMRVRKLGMLPVRGFCVGTNALLDQTFKVPLRRLSGFPVQDQGKKSR